MKPTRRDFIKANADAVSAVISARVALDEVLDAVEKTKSGQALKSVILFN